MELQLVIFDLAQETFGVDISVVESIIKMQEITKVPRSPEFVEGVTNLRGKVLPVMDLRKRLGMAAEVSTKDSRIVVIDLHDTYIGMIVDSVNEVLRINAEAVEPPPPMVASIDTEFMRGIAKLDGRLVILLDLEKVLTVDEESALKAMPA